MNYTIIDDSRQNTMNIIQDVCESPRILCSLIRTLTKKNICDLHMFHRVFPLQNIYIC